jgi:hypothetical protein
MRLSLLKSAIVPLALGLGLVAADTRDASAFCGFYVGGADQKLFNNATMVVMMREGTRTVLSMQNNYQGPPEAFAMVVPVPVVLQKENVKTLPREVFDHIDQLAAPRLVEYWEQDPCPVERPEMETAMPMAAPAGAAAMEDGAERKKDLGVRIEAQFAVGEYEILILSAQDSGGLETWLKLNKYKIPDGAEPVLRPYVAKGMKFFVAKVDPKRVQFENGQAVLSPLRFHYDAEDFSLPVRLGLLNSGGTQDLIVHILARNKRYEVANYPNVTIPTNYDVSETAKDKFGQFYAALFDRTVETHPGAVVTEYSWDAQSCDPCPGPALDPGTITTLGADALAPAVAPRQQFATNGDLQAVVSVGDVASGNKVTNAAATVAQRISSFQACYVSQLRVVQEPKGDVTVNLKLGRAGEVTEVKTVGGKGLPLNMVECVVNNARTLRFAQPTGGSATVEFPIKFDLRQGPPGAGWNPPPPPPEVNPYGFTLTRLHTRYKKDALGADLVFSEATPIVGGREDFGKVEQDHGAIKDSGTNNFQGRYIIRHPWTGPVACANPKRGVWGGPPAGVQADSSTKSAQKIAFVPRDGNTNLASFLRQSIPELHVAAASPLPPVSGSNGGVVAEPGARGCGGCAVDSGPGAALPCSIAAFLALLANDRRRRRELERKAREKLNREDVK